MVNLQKSGDSAVKFVFTDSDHYLYGNGEIEVPVNGLLLVIDESDMVTFKKLSGDPFLSFRADNSNLGTKAAIEQFYKDNMVGSTGGGSESGITSGEVQTMIDNSLEDYYTDDEVDAALSGKASVSDVTALENEVATKANTSAVTAAIDALTAHTANTTVHVTSAEKTAWNAKQDALYIYTEDNNLGTAELHSNDSSIIFNAGGASITANNTMGVNTFNVASTGVTINGENVATEPYVDDAVSGKVDTSAITSSITSGSTDSEIPTAKATYDAIQAGGGGGATYSAGTNISIDTGNTISCTLNLRNGTGNRSIQGLQSNAGGENSIAIGTNARTSQEASVAIGGNTNARLKYESAFGFNNISNLATIIGFGNSGNTLMSIGNGPSSTSKHNALEIRQNGDIYFADTDNTTYANYYQKPMVRLQDMYAALGGLKFVQCTQAEYDALVSGGTVDSSTIYFITNVVS